MKNQGGKKRSKNSQESQVKHEIITEESPTTAQKQQQYGCRFYQALIFLLVMGFISVLVGIQISQKTDKLQQKLPPLSSNKSQVKVQHNQVEKVKIGQLKGNDVYSFEIRQRINRSKKELFYTQGLVFANDTILFESAGLLGHSEIHSIDIRNPDEVQISTLNGKEIFGEGCDIIQNNVYQLTWKNDKVFFYDPLNLKYKAEKSRPQPMAEGWGITHRVKDNETQIFLTDGSNKIYWAHQNLTIFKTSEIFYNNHDQVKLLNELEYANGLIYANIYLSSYVVAINIDEEKVVKIYDLSTLRQEVLKTKGFEGYVYDYGNCLNGIAYYEPNNTFWLTGKLWPYFWEVEF